MSLVTANTDGKRIYVRVPSVESPMAVDKLEQIPGCNYRKGARDWSLPLSLVNCRELRQIFGMSLLVTVPLAEWARAEIARTDGLEAVRTGSAPIELGWVANEAPDLFKAISQREYQPIGAEFMCQGRTVLLGDDPGLGKTLQTLAALVEDGAQRILVSCPRTACRNVWEAETLRWAPGIRTFVAQGSRRDREKAMERFAFAANRGQAGQFMLIINNEMMRMKPEICPDGPVRDCLKVGPRAPIRALTPMEEGHEHQYNVAEYPFLHESDWDAVVIDESHNMLASTKNSQSKDITQSRYGAVSVRRQITEGGMALALSGTPFRSRLTKSWGTLNWLDPVHFNSYWQFAQRHFGVVEGAYGKEVGGGAKLPKPLDMDAFNAELRPYYLAREKKLVAKDLPDIIYTGTPNPNDVRGPEDPPAPNAVWLDMEPRQRRAYEEMRDLAKARLEEGELTATGVLAEITRLRQFACSFGRMVGERQMVPELPSNKLEWLVEFFLEHDGRDDKFVIASSFTSFIEKAAPIICKEMRDPNYVMTLTGKTSDRNRARLVERFRDPDDPARVVFLNSKAGGEAITLDSADDMAFTDLPWTSDEATQVESRIHRVSRIHQVFVHRLLSKGTIEEWIFSLTDDQKAILQAAKPEGQSMLLEAL